MVLDGGAIDQGWQTSSNGLGSKVASHLALLQLFNSAVEQRQPQTVINEHGHVPILLYLQNQAAGQI